jgi:signal transduction histidine kinase
MLPAVIWVALRFGPRGATLAITVMSGFAIWESTHALGPFGIDSIGGRLLGTQLFIATLALSALFIAALATERERLIERVRASRARLVTASDEARRRLERDLHDGAQQRLVTLAARLTRSATEAGEAHGQVAAEFETAASDVLIAIEELREFAHGVHPSVLRHFGLAAAVRAIAARSTITIDPIQLPRQRLDGTSEATAYYIVLEAITNAERYARASAVSVRARLHHGRLILDVADDGVGGAVERDGSGLQGLRDRVEATRGRFRVESQRGRGTHITAEFPVGFGPNSAGHAAARS